MKPRSPSGNDQPCPKAKRGWHIFAPKGQKELTTKRCLVCGALYDDLQKEGQNA